MASNRPESHFEKLFSSLESSIANNQQLLADLFPFLESSETKTRRQEFQAALDQFYFNELKEEKNRQDFFARINIERAEEDSLHQEKQFLEKKAQEIIQAIENRNYDEISQEEREREKERDKERIIFIKKILESITQLNLRIEQLSQVIKQLQTLKLSISLKIDAQLEEIENIYHKLAKQAQKGETLYITFPPAEKGKAPLKLAFRPEEAFNYLAKAMPESMRNKPIASHEFDSVERENMRNYWILQYEDLVRQNHPTISEESFKKLTDEPRFKTLIEYHCDILQRFRKENPLANEELHITTGLITMYQSQYSQIESFEKAATAMRDSALMLKDQLEKKLENTLTDNISKMNFSNNSQSDNSALPEETIFLTLEESEQLLQASSLFTNSIEIVQEKIEFATEAHLETLTAAAIEASAKPAANDDKIAAEPKTAANDDNIADKKSAANEEAVPEEAHHSPKLG